MEKIAAIDLQDAHTHTLSHINCPTSWQENAFWHLFELWPKNESFVIVCSMINSNGLIECWSAYCISHKIKK